jgi:hypothetical protein
MNDAAFPVSSWQQALESLDPTALLALNAYHFAGFLKLAPAFADLKRQLRFSDDDREAKATYIYEVLICLLADGPGAAAAHCRRLTDLLENEYACRHCNTEVAA